MQDNTCRIVKWLTPHFPLSNYCVICGRKVLIFKHLIFKISVQFYFLIVIKGMVQASVVNYSCSLFFVVCSVLEFKLMDLQN